jgi:transcriptional regulator with XRE-family HTH domain
MSLDRQDVREIIERLSARQDMQDACHRRDLGAIIRILGSRGVTQGQIAGLTGIAQGRLSEYSTGKRVPSASSTFEAFADGLAMPPAARRALGLAPAGGVGAAGAEAGLGVPADTFDLQLIAEDIGRRGDSVKRRELLSIVAGLGATTALAQSEVWERLAYALTHPTAMNEAIVREMEARCAGFHRLEEVMPAQALFKGLAAHLREVSTLLNGTATDPASEMRSRLIVVAGQSSVLAGWAASDMGDSSTARNFYETAERAAHEADDPAIAACALAYRSYIPSTKGANGRARVLLTNALDILPESGSPATLSWLAARHAEESAALGDKAQALKSWARADEAFNVADPEEDRVWTRFLDQNRFDSYRIATYAKIGKLDEAQETARAVLARLARPDRKKAAIILEDIAVAHLSRGSVSEATKLAAQGLAVVRETEFAMWLPRYETIARSVRRYDNQPQVRAFLEELAMTKRQFASSPR